MPPGHAIENNGCRVYGVAVRKLVVVSGFMRLCLTVFERNVEQTRLKTAPTSTNNDIQNDRKWCILAQVGREGDSKINKHMNK